MRKESVLFSIMAFSSIAYAGERLEGAALRAFWTGKTIVGTHFKLGPIKTYHGEDGSVNSKAASGKERVGKWWIDTANNKKCIEWNGDGKKRCHYTELNDDSTHTLIHGKKGTPLVQISEALEGNQL